MGFRNVLITEDCKLKLKLNNLIVVKSNGDEVSIPINDINSIVIDNFDVTLTIRLMENLAQNNVSVITCNKQHLPVGIYTGMNIHSRSTKVLNKQISLEENKKAELWEKITKIKIKNQRQVLEMTDCTDESIKKLNEYYIQVQYYDETNREGHAAKVYFNELFGKDFSRDDDNFLINSALNYGYAIVRAHIARLCVSYGLNTTLGVFHKNEYNQFNLCDDLIEPFRPIVDLLSIKIMYGENLFTIKHRRELISIVDHKIFYQNKKMYLANVLDEFVSSYSNFLENGNIDTIKFPDVKDFEFELEYEV